MMYPYMILGDETELTHSQNDLNKLLEVIEARFFLICAEWKEHFCENEIKFYC